MDVISAKLDIIFKKLFLSDLAVLTDFIGALLDIPKGGIQNLEVLNPEIPPTYYEGKQGQLDIKMTVDEKVVNVEIQMQNKGDYKDRTLFYWSKLYSDELKKGDPYTELKQTICINILNFNLFECEEAYSTFKLLETKRHEVLTEKCSLLFFELKKVNKKINKNNRKDLWLQLLNAETEEELTMLKETGEPEINKAVVILHEMSEDEKVREMARLREKWLRDDISAIAHAKKEGRAEGRAEERAEIIEKLRRNGMSEEEINRFLYS